MGCSVNPICYPCQLHHSICASNWLRLILKSSLGGTHHYLLEKGYKISWTDCRNSTPLHSLFQTMSDSSHHKCLLLCRRSVCFKLSSVQLGRPKAPCKNFNLWLLCVHPANSSYVPWFQPQVVCRALFSQGWSILFIPSLRASSPVWENEVSLARTRERAASLAQIGELAHRLLHAKLAYPSNWLKPFATCALTPYFILLTCLVKLSFHILHTTFTTLTLPLLLWAWAIFFSVSNMNSWLDI